MRSSPLIFIAALCVLAACADETASGPAARSVPSTGGIQAMSFANSEWSAPVNVGAPVNSAASEQQPALSADELSLYFSSNRAGGAGGMDLWVSHRASKNSPWEVPVNVAPTNTASDDNSPNVSIDGHLLFFHSARPDGLGGTDIYVSRRADPNDDLGWEPPVNLGSDVNTEFSENAPAYLQSAEDGAANLYFQRGAGSGADIYVAAVTRDGATRGPAERVEELSVPNFQDGHVTVRKDGREIIFFSNRPGSLGTTGLSDLWTSTRQSGHEPWSAPVNLGAPINTGNIDTQPTLSADGRTLVFSSTRAGGLGVNDIWVMTRTPSGN